MFTGPTPADSTAWRALFDAVVALEKPLYIAGTSAIKGYGHDSVDPHADAVWSIDLRVAPNSPQNGSYNGAGGQAGQGDSAAWVRWGLDRFKNGKRVYLRKYFHPAYVTTGQPDNILAAWITLANTFATKMSDGTLDGTRKVTDKLGTNIVNTGVSTYATTRTLKRRGKKKKTTT
jgi:hypothetical protein